MFTRHPYTANSISAPYTISFHGFLEISGTLEYVKQDVALKMIVERIIISIINGNSRVILKFDKIECVSSDRRVQSH
jgi:hypothetical protein